jgi:hypothetical protein
VSEYITSAIIWFIILTQGYECVADGVMTPGGEIEVFGENLPSVTLSTKNPIYSDLGSNRATTL